jgi:homoserine O-acetyltransferase
LIIEALDGCSDAVGAGQMFLDFADDEFNPVELRVLEELMPRVRDGRFIVQPASEESLGHLTMAHPELWSEHVAEFMRSLGDEALRSIEK